MQFHWTIFGAPPLAIGFVLLGMAVYSWRRSAAKVSTPLTALLVAIATWIVGYGLEILAASAASKLAFAKLQYLGIVCVAPGVFVTAMEAAGHGRWLTRPRLATLAALPAATLALAWTNGLHGWIWSSVRLAPQGPFPALDLDHGPAYYAFVAYSHVCLAAATAILFARYRKAWRYHRREASLVLTGIAAPWVAHTLYTADVHLIPNLDLTPFAFAITGVTLGAGLQRGLLDVVRVARTVIVESMVDAVLVVDAHDRLIDANTSARLLLDIDPRGVVPVAEALADHEQLLRDLARPGTGRREIPLAAAGGAAMYELEVSLLEDGTEAGGGRVFALRDITERKRAEAALRESEARHRTMVESVPIAITEIDTDGRYLAMNPAGVALAGLESADTVIGRPYLEFVSDEDRERAEALLTRALWGEACEFEVTTAIGENPRLYASSLIPVVGDDGAVARIISHSQDLTERRRTEEKIRNLAYYDPLTGLPNRQRFRARLERSLTSARRSNTRLGLLFIDLDGFKSVNDSLGHSVGDQLLREVASRLDASIREADIVGRTARRSGAGSPAPSSEIARLGGDEFTVLLSEISSPVDAERIARRLVEALDGPIEIDRQEIFTSASVGIAIFPEDGAGAEELLRSADIAMYHAKAAGRNHYQFFTRSMNAAGARKLEVEGHLRRALDNGDLELHYQPVRSCRDARLVGTEALMRWNDPELGPVAPDEFIPIAEESGLIGRIGALAIEAAAAQASAWIRDGYRPIRVAVNLSGHQLRNLKMVDDLQLTLAAAGFPPAYLEIEITERTLMDHDEPVMNALLRLTDLGIGLSLDDFGTGFSSLAYLRNFPVDRIKIDRSFIREIPDNADDRLLTSAIITMAHGLGMSVVAEGVENRAQLDFLREAGCDDAQGFLLSPPIPPSEFEAFLEREKTE